MQRTYDNGKEIRLPLDELNRRVNLINSKLIEYKNNGLPEVNIREMCKELEITLAQYHHLYNNGYIIRYNDIRDEYYKELIFTKALEGYSIYEISKNLNLPIIYTNRLLIKKRYGNLDTKKMLVFLNNSSSYGYNDVLVFLDITPELYSSEVIRIKEKGHNILRYNILCEKIFNYCISNEYQKMQNLAYTMNVSGELKAITYGSNNLNASIDELIKMSKLSRNTIIKLIANGKIPKGNRIIGREPIKNYYLTEKKKLVDEVKNKIRPKSYMYKSIQPIIKFEEEHPNLDFNTLMDKMANLVNNKVNRLSKYEYITLTSYSFLSIQFITNNGFVNREELISILKEIKSNYSFTIEEDFKLSTNLKDDDLYKETLYRGYTENNFTTMNELITKYGLNHKKAKK